jgi:hypothetical protein
MPLLLLIELEDNFFCNCQLHSNASHIFCTPTLKRDSSASKLTVESMKGINVQHVPLPRPDHDVQVTKKL